jgi:hypothetical protein
MGQFIITVLNSLVNVYNEADDASFQVFVQFLEPKFWMPYSLTTSDALTDWNKLKVSYDGEADVVAEGFNEQGRREPVIGNFTLDKIGAPQGNQFTVERMFHPKIGNPGGNIISINPMESLKNANDTDNSAMNSVDKDNKVSPLLGVGGSSVDETNINFVLRTPMLVATYQLYKSTDTTQVLQPFACNSAVYYDWIRSMFKLWGGGAKIWFNFVASPLHNVKVAIMFGSNGLKTMWQEQYNRIVDIQGTTDEMFYIPYTYQGFASPSTTFDGATISVKVLSWSQPNDLDTVIFLNVYKAGGEDAWVGGLMDNCLYLQAPTSFGKSRMLLEKAKGKDKSQPKVEKKKIFEEHSSVRGKFFDVPFEPFHPSFKTMDVPPDIVVGERVKSLKDIVSRYVPYFGATEGAIYFP